jgi:hypothetical protein
MRVHTGLNLFNFITLNAQRLSERTVVLLAITAHCFVSVVIHLEIPITLLLKKGAFNSLTDKEIILHLYNLNIHPPRHEMYSQDAIL